MSLSLTVLRFTVFSFSIEGVASSSLYCFLLRCSSHHILGTYQITYLIKSLHRNSWSLNKEVATQDQMGTDIKSLHSDFKCLTIARLLFGYC